MMNLLTARLCASLLVLVFFSLQTLAGAPLPVLHTKTDTYANVTVISRTATHVFVQHSRGVANIKLQALDVEALRGMGLVAADSVADAANSPAATARETALTRMASSTSLSAGWRRWFPGGTKIPQISARLLPNLVGIFLIVYLSFCYCAMLICRKAGRAAGFLIWLPVVKIFPLLRAAGLSNWWFIAWLLPGANLVALVVWALKIARACGKSWFTGVLLILPGTNIFAFLYLAFSGHGSAAEGSVAERETEPLPA